MENGSSNVRKSMEISKNGPATGWFWSVDTVQIDARRLTGLGRPGT